MMIVSNIPSDLFCFVCSGFILLNLAAVLECCLSCVCVCVCVGGGIAQWISTSDIIIIIIIAAAPAAAAIELSLGGSSPYNSTDKTNKNKYS